MNVFTLPIAYLHLDPANARRHPERNLASIKASLARFGQQTPIVIDSKNVVRKGNGTLAAAKELGWETIQCVKTDLAGVEATAYAVADNRTGELAEWDQAVLAETLEALRSEPEFDLADVGFTGDEVDALLEGITSGIAGPLEGGEDAGPQMDRAGELQEKWKVAPGDLWEIPSLTVAGKCHRLLCGDSTKAEDVARVMGRHLAALLVTSPPYNQSIDKFRPSGMHKEGGWVAKVENLAYADSLPEDEYQSQQRAALKVWFAVLAEGASVFYNHKNRYREKQVVSPLAWLPGPFKLRQEIVWSRPGSVTQNARMFLPSDERIYWMYKGEDFYFDDTTENKSLSSVWDIPLEANKEHAVAFPLELPSRPIRACSKPGDIVFEPYVGSGTTVVAAESLGRITCGLELLALTLAVALERLSALGLEPRKIA